MTVRERVWAVVGRVCGDDYTESSANFYELGGDSLLADQLMAALRTEFGEGLPVTVLFEAPDMGAFVEEAVTQLNSRSPQQGGS